MNKMRKSGQVRIIGGKWRGRKLAVATVVGCRPTPDRVRETLFNWLMPYLPGAYCLDAFAGSGALGFEALSRGAAYAVFVDRSEVVVESLRQALQRLTVGSTDPVAEIYQAVVPQQLKKPEHLFNIVFLDPPYSTNDLLTGCFYLEENDFLAEGAYIYLESNAPLPEANLPKYWRVIKTKKAGQVAYQLIVRSSQNDK